VILIFKRIRSKIGLKLMAVFSLSLMLLMFFLLYAGKWLITELSDFHIAKNQAHMMDHAYESLSGLAREKTLRYNSTFQRIAASSSLLAKQAGFFLDHISLYGNTPLNPNENLRVYPPNGIFSNSAFEVTMVNYWGGTEISPEISAELNALSHADPLIIEAKKIHPECVASHIITESGIRRYFPNVHAVIELPRPEAYDMRNEGFYEMANPENNPARKTVWSRVYQGYEGNGLMTTASAPVYDKMGQYLGIAGIDITLDKISNHILNDKKLNPQREARSLFSFITDNTGRIIIFPLAYLKMFGLETEGDVPEHSEIFFEKSLADSSIPEIRKMAGAMIARDRQTVRVPLGEHPHVVFLNTMPSTGWCVGMVLSEKAILTSVRESLMPLNSVIRRTIIGFVSITLLLLFLLIVVSSVFPVKCLITYLNKRYLKFRDELMESYLQMQEDLEDDDLELGENLPMEGDPEKPDAEIPRDKTGVLANSYNKMVETLQKLNELEKEHSVELQKEIAERKRAEQEIRHLSSQLINIGEEGKKELAQDLHDEFGQTLAALHMGAETLLNAIPEEMSMHKQGMGELVGLVENLGDKIRSISSDLRPDLLDDLGLVPTLEWYIKEFLEQRQDIQINFQAVGLRRRFSSEIELVLYRIFQESLNNIVKHAKAGQVSVTLTYSHPNAIFVITDDGVGFDEHTRGRDGIGLLGMRERVVSVNGRINIRSAKEKGTSIRVEVPVVSDI